MNWPSIRAAEAKHLEDTPLGPLTPSGEAEGGKGLEGTCSLTDSLYPLCVQEKDL